MLTSDTDKKNQSEIAQTRQKAYIAQQTTNANASEEEIRARARQDPEVQQIMSDPVMRNILDQMQNEPEAVREYDFGFFVMFFWVLSFWWLVGISRTPWSQRRSKSLSMSASSALAATKTREMRPESELSAFVFRCFVLFRLYERLFFFLVDPTRGTGAKQKRSNG